MSDQPGVVEALARSIAASGLDASAEPSAPVEVPDAAWGRLLARIRFERMTGLAVEIVAAGSIRLSAVQADALLAEHRNEMAWCLGVERKLVGLADAFDGEGVAFAVLKGSSIAHTVYPDPCLRSFADVDLLVSSADYERACALLGRLGHLRQQPEPRPGFDVRFGKASVHKHPEDDIEVDLHRTLVVGPFGLWIDPDELLERREPFMLAGRKLSRLDDTGMLLNVAMHASLGWSPPRLVPLRDVVQVTNAGLVDWGALERWCKDWHMTAVLERTFSLTASTLGASTPPELARISRSVPSAERRALQRYEGGRRAAGGTALGTFGAIPGVRSKAAYAAALLFPGRAFLQSRTTPGRRPSYLRRLSVPARWIRSRS
jgi:hypothetical protein